MEKGDRNDPYKIKDVPTILCECIREREGEGLKHKDLDKSFPRPDNTMTKLSIHSPSVAPLSSI